MEYITRSIEKSFLEANRTYKVVLVVGAEQIGKTTMMKHLSQGQNRTYVSLDDLHPRTLADTEPDLFFEIFRPPVIINEIHFVPSILHKMKEICEQSEESGLFWLACPPKAAFIKDAKDILGSSVVVLEMYGLSMREKKNLALEAPLHFSYDEMKVRERLAPKKNSAETFRHIWRGGLPDMIDISQKNKTKRFWHYFYEGLMYQVQQSKKVKHLTEFSDFLSACAVNICKVLSVRRLAQASGVSCPTATKWLQLLIDIGVIYLLEPYENDEIPRLIGRPKLYFTDTGLCSYISNWKTPEELMYGAESAAYFENFVIMELVKNFANRSDGIKLRFLRDCNCREIDVVVVAGRKLHPFEIDKAAAPWRDVTKKFSLFDEKSIIRGSGGIICSCKEVELIDEQNYLLPCHLL